MLLRIISIEGELYNDEVQKILLPTTNGVIGVLPDHINLVSPLSVGSIVYFPKEYEKSSLDLFTDHNCTIDIQGGLMVIEDNIVTVTVE